MSMNASIVFETWKEGMKVFFPLSVPFCFPLSINDAQADFLSLPYFFPPNFLNLGNCRSA